MSDTTNTIKIETVPGTKIALKIRDALKAHLAWRNSDRVPNGMPTFTLGPFIFEAASTSVERVTGIFRIMHEIKLDRPIIPFPYCECDGLADRHLQGKIGCHYFTGKMYDHVARAAQTVLERPCIGPDVPAALAVLQKLFDDVGLIAPPIPMRLPCPFCHALHVDAPPWDSKPHHTHACQSCGGVWRPAIPPTVGVRFLPGFKNQEDEE